MIVSDKSSCILELNKIYFACMHGENNISGQLDFPLALTSPPHSAFVAGKLVACVLSRLKCCRFPHLVDPVV